MTEITFKTHPEVDLIKSSASDQDIAWAARVSTQGERANDLTGEDQKVGGLITYLMKNRHGSPFEHSVLTYLVSAPIFTAREFMRHRIASYNEESGRYKQLEPVFYMPGGYRKLRQVGKAGQYEYEYGTPGQYDVVRGSYSVACREAYQQYERMLEEGIAREVARGVLPVNIFTSFYVTINSRSLMNFLSLRTQRANSTYPSFPQYEIQQVADRMEDLWRGVMPETWAAFNANGRVAP